MKRFAIIDVETTGGNPRTDRIMEIGIVLFDGDKIIDTFSSLVYPETPVPYFITKITGITTDMVKNAPRFFEIAKKIVEITEGAIFVAHNVRFDYGFVQREFRNLGYSYSRPQLDTVRLAQKLVPEAPSHSLSNLCKHLKIENKNAHRALSDAIATTHLLKHLLALNENPDTQALVKDQIAEVKTPPNLPKEVFDNLPDETGVYYWHNAEGEVIYVGKALSIQSRIKSHFSEAHKRTRSLRMFQEVTDISYELTGSEIIALLLEDEEIKRLQPKFNRRQRRVSYSYGIFSEPDAQGYLRLKVERLTGVQKPESCYTFRRSAEAALQRRIELHNLCHNLCGMATGGSSCFRYQIHICKGACVGKESPDLYNERVEAAISYMNYGKADFFILGDGRNYYEKSIVAVRNGAYCGYGYLDTNHPIQTLNELETLIPFKTENPDILQIIRNYLKKHPKEIKSWEKGKWV